jgi:serine O-acetyltransferase
MFENVRRDLVRACRGNQGGQVGFWPLMRELWNPGTQAILVHRFGYWSNVRAPGVRHALRVLHFVLQYFFAWRVGIFIPIRAAIGPGMVIHTWGGGIFLPRARIGRDLTIVGGGIQLDYETREIGDDVWIGPGTKGVGKIRIGSRVRIGPNSVLQTDIPDDCVVFANAARVMGPMPRHGSNGGMRTPERTDAQHAALATSKS